MVRHSGVCADVKYTVCVCSLATAVPGISLFSVCPLGTCHKHAFRSMFQDASLAS